MMTIDPRTLSVGPGAGGRGVALVVISMVIALAAGQLGRSLFPRGAIDDDFSCVEDVRGACDLGPETMTFDEEPDVLLLPFPHDDAWANSPGEYDDDVAGVAEDDSLPIPVEIVTVSDSDSLPALPAAAFPR